MAVDIETEILQIWAAIRVIATTIRNKLPQDEGSLTFAALGSRSGREHELAGLQQILKLSESFALELAIKALYKEEVPNHNPAKTHDLLQLFNSLPRLVKARLNAKWNNTNDRSVLAQQLTLDEFLGEHRKLFEDSRYLYEKSTSGQFSSMDFELALWVVVHEIIEKRPNDEVLVELLKILHEGQM